MGGRFAVRLAYGLGMIPRAWQRGFHAPFQRSAEEGTGSSARRDNSPVREQLLPDLGALETATVDQRRMAVRIDRPVVIPSIAHVVMLGVFQLQTGSLFSRFRGIRFDHRFAEHRIHVGN